MEARNVENKNRAWNPKTIKLLGIAVLAMTIAVAGLLLWLNHVKMAQVRAEQVEALPLTAAVFSDGEMRLDWNGETFYYKTVDIDDPAFSDAFAALLMQAEPFRPYSYSLERTNGIPDFSVAVYSAQTNCYVNFYDVSAQLALDYAYRDAPVILIEKTDFIVPEGWPDGYEDRTVASTWQAWCVIPPATYAELINLLASAFADQTPIPRPRITSLRKGEFYEKTDSDPLRSAGYRIGGGDRYAFAARQGGSPAVIRLVYGNGAF